MFDKPIKEVRGQMKKWDKGQHPTHDPKRKVYNFRCAFCGYKARHRLYVCPTCGNCQACGITNATGDVNLSCQVCGNGASVPDLPVPTIDTGRHFDKPALIKRINVEAQPHKKKQSSTSINVTNIQANG